MTHRFTIIHDDTVFEIDTFEFVGEDMGCVGMKIKHKDTPDDMVGARPKKYNGSEGVVTHDDTTYSGPIVGTESENFYDSFVIQVERKI